MIRSLVLKNYKAFRHFTLILNGDAILVGPNNAGKSTLVGALRGCAGMLRHARSRTADAYAQIGDEDMPVYSFSDSERFGIQSENLRHEFNAADTTLRLDLSNDLTVTACWPGDEGVRPGAGYFVLTQGPRAFSRPRDVRAAFPVVAVTPTLSPLMPRERILSTEYVREHLDTDRSSLHFRNQLRLLRLDQEEGQSGEAPLDSFAAYIAEHTPEIALAEVVDNYSGEKPTIDVFFRDAEGRVERELAWSGDGMQIWLQLLLHLYRSRGASVLILDEPDVYLHADLQRRLTGILEEWPGQIVLTTHSAEVVAEAPPERLVLVERSRRRSRAAKSPEVLGDFSDAVNSQFNLRLARALRAKCVLFVEGKDMAIVRVLAARLGFDNVATERRIVVIPLEGYSNWEHVEAFTKYLNLLLPDALQTFVVLDGDYKPLEEREELEERLHRGGVGGHVWRRKELESYLLEPGSLARVCRISEGDVVQMMREISDELKTTVFARVSDERLRKTTAKRHRVTVLEEVDAEITELWKDPWASIWACPAKDVIARINARLQGARKKAVSPTALARGMQRNEIDAEMAKVLAAVRNAAADGGIGIRA